jgi:hypothetical protein
MSSSSLDLALYLRSIRRWERMLLIHDRAKAVAWFKQMLADYDATH